MTQPVHRPVVVVADAADETLVRAAQALAEELGRPIVPLAIIHEHPAELRLLVEKRGLALVDASSPRTRPFRVDFVSGPTGFRMRADRSHRQPLARACGLHLGLRDILDATAGFGRDAFHLACLGCHVRAIERSPVVAAMFRDGLQRAAACNSKIIVDAASRIRIVVADARDVLPELPESDRPEVIYLDPMYSARRKMVAVTKEMRSCRELVGNDNDAAELLDEARRTARRRVVVKRHRTAPPLALDPDESRQGATVRYDVYFAAS